MNTPIENPNTHKMGRPAHRPILRTEIEEAQKHTNSSAQAARWLNVTYKQYKKYAELYGIFERHKNPLGIGIPKGFAKRPTSIPLKDILAGNHPNYSRAKLKNRLIARKKIQEECSLCGFKEQRITDKKIPLMLSHKDGNQKNYQLENLELLCYNCMFLTTGAPSVVYRHTIPKALKGQSIHSRSTERPMTEADKYEPDSPIDEPFLTPDEYDTLLDTLEIDDAAP